MCVNNGFSCFRLKILSSQTLKKLKEEEKILNYLGKKQVKLLSIKLNQHYYNVLVMSSIKSFLTFIAILTENAAMFERGAVRVARSYENPWWKTKKVELGLCNIITIN